MNTATESIVPVAVAGADLDQSLCSQLTPRDSVMVEINGARVYSRLRCPLLAESPWIVVSNDDERIVLRHRSVKHDLVLHYTNLLPAANPRQTAVFVERDERLSSGPVYVLLQFVSHVIPADQVDTEYQPYNPNDAKIVLADAEFRYLVIDAWREALAGFNGGWGQKSVNRLAMRSFVKPSEIEAIRDGDCRSIAVIERESLYRIHEAIYWLPHQLTTAGLAVQRDVYTE